MNQPSKPVGSTFSCRKCNWKPDPEGARFCGRCGASMGLAWWEKALLVGLPAFMALVFVGLVSGAGRKPRAHEERGGDAVAAAPTPDAESPAAPVDTLAVTDVAMRFLYGIRGVYGDALERCGAASGCAVVDRSAPPIQGAVGDVREVPACIRERLAPCEAAAALVTAQTPPPSIAAMWSELLRGRLAEALRRARGASELVESGRRLRLPRANTRESVFEALPNTDPVRRRALDLDGTAFADPSAWTALDAWLIEHGACVGAQLPQACGFAAILGDDHRKVGARYADWYRPEQSPAEKHIRGYLAKRYSSSPERLVDVELRQTAEGTQASIYVRAGENLTVGMIRSGALLEARDIIRELSAAPGATEVGLYDVSLLYTLQDALNRDVEQQVMRAKLRADLARQVNWEGLYAKQFERLLLQVGSLYVHDALESQD